MTDLKLFKEANGRKFQIQATHRKFRNTVTLKANLTEEECRAFEPDAAHRRIYKYFRIAYDDCNPLYLAGMHPGSRLVYEIVPAVQSPTKDGRYIAIIGGHAFDVSYIVGRGWGGNHFPEYWCRPVSQPEPAGELVEQMEKAFGLIYELTPPSKEIIAKCAQVAQSHIAAKEGIQMPAGLHPESKSLVLRFATAIAEKMYKSEVKYGWTNEWQTDDWEEDCKTGLYEHLKKGDPKDVAVYAAFMWHHGWDTKPEVVAPEISARSLREGYESMAHTIAAKEGELAYITKIRDDYATAARVISLYLKPYCDETLVFSEMIAEASRRAAADLEAKEGEIVRLREALTMARGWIGQHISSETRLRQINADIDKALT
jgi:hypothetical protein